VRTKNFSSELEFLRTNLETLEILESFVQGGKNNKYEW